MITRPRLSGVVELAKQYEEGDMLHIGLYLDGSFSVGTDFPEDSDAFYSFRRGRDARKSCRNALDEIEKILVSNKQKKQKASIEDDE